MHFKSYALGSPPHGCSNFTVSPPGLFKDKHPFALFFHLLKMLLSVGNWCNVLLSVKHQSLPLGERQWILVFIESEFGKVLSPAERSWGKLSLIVHRLLINDLQAAGSKELCIPQVPSLRGLFFLVAVLSKWWLSESWPYIWVEMASSSLTANYCISLERLWSLLSVPMLVSDIGSALLGR